MKGRYRWIQTKIRFGWSFLVLGIIVAIAGIAVQNRYLAFPYNLRIITGLGILLAGIGLAILIRYNAAKQDRRSQMRVHAEEHDERSVSIRQRAGNRAYWCSVALIYAILMWESFASNGSLPLMSRDMLWYCLAAGILIPFGVYAASTLIDEHKF